MAMGLLKGVLYLKAMIRMIEIQKNLTILEVEQGKEVYIPRELSLDRLPTSYRFYDFLINYVKEQVSAERKEFYGLKKALTNSMHKKLESNYLLEKMGLNDVDERLVYRIKLNDPSRVFEINHLRSEHTMDVQRSRYISIDNEMALKQY